MFKRQYTATILNSKWEVVKNRMKFITIPRSGEYLFFDGLYHEVLNIVYTLEGKQGIFVIINEIPHQLKQLKNSDL
jgi:hypothetical protein